MKQHLCVVLAGGFLGLGVASCMTSDEWSDFADTVTGVSSTASSSSSLSASDFSIELDQTPLTETETYTGNEGDLLEEDPISKTLTLTFSDSSVSVSGTIDSVTYTISGAHIVITSYKKVHYVLQGSSSNGSFKLYSENKGEIELSNLTLTNPTGAAINVQSKKRMFIYLADGTESTLCDGSDYTAQYDANGEEEDQKGVIFSEGQLVFCGPITSLTNTGSGVLNIEAVGKSCVASDQYVRVRPGVVLNLTASAKHAIKANDSIIVSGGVINATVTSTGGKGLKSDAYTTIAGGRTTVLTSAAGAYNSEDQDVDANAGVKSDSLMQVIGGQLFCKSTGTGGKGISTDLEYRQTGGEVRIITTGKTYTYSSSLDSKAKGLKSDTQVNISGGTILVYAAGGDGSEGIESKSTMNISGGTINVAAYDDALNSAKQMTISGGSITAVSANNDGLDANANLVVEGGTVVACGAGSPECSIDAAEGYSTLFNGGYILGIGGTSITPSSGSSMAYVSKSTSVSGGTAISLASGSTSLATFTVPSDYSLSGQVLVSCPELTSGSSYTLTIGSSSSSVTARTGSSSSNSGGGMHW